VNKSAEDNALNQNPVSGWQRCWKWMKEKVFRYKYVDIFLMTAISILVVVVIGEVAFRLDSIYELFDIFNILLYKNYIRKNRISYVVERFLFCVIVASAWFIIIGFPFYLFLYAFLATPLLVLFFGHNFLQCVKHIYTKQKMREKIINIWISFVYFIILLAFFYTPHIFFYTPHIYMSRSSWYEMHGIEMSEHEIIAEIYLSLRIIRGSYYLFLPLLYIILFHGVSKLGRIVQDGQNYKIELRRERKEGN